MSRLRALLREVFPRRPAAPEVPGWRRDRRRALAAFVGYCALLAAYEAVVLWAIP